MTSTRVEAQRLTGREAIVNVTPRLKASVHWIDAVLLNGDCLGHRLGFRPA
jgi:hypothetical protein